MNHNCTDDGPVRRRPSDDKEQGLVLVTCLVIEHGVVECLKKRISPLRLSVWLRKVDFWGYWGLLKNPTFLGIS